MNVRPDVRLHRIGLGLTREQFAEQTGVTARVVRQAEAGGALHVNNAKVLGDYFGVDPIVFVDPPILEGQAA